MTETSNLVDVPRPDQRSAAAMFAGVFLIAFIVCVIVLIWLAFERWFYWDENQSSPLFAWSVVLFFLTKGPVLNIGGAAVFALIGGLLTAAAGLFEGKKAVRNVTALCCAGILSTLILWIKLSQDEEVFGEISALAGSNFAHASPERREAEVSAALDYVMGAFLVWWVVTAATVLGLRRALEWENLKKFRRFFLKSGGGRDEAAGRPNTP